MIKKMMGAALTVILVLSSYGITAAAAENSIDNENTYIMDTAEEVVEQEIGALASKGDGRTYSIFFSGNGEESGEMAPIKVEYSKSRKLPANTFKKKGYTFSGWNTEREGKGIEFKNKATIEKLTEEDNGIIILYAQWKLNTYNVVFSGNGKTSGTMNEMMELEYDKEYTLPKNTFEKEGCIFLGWTKAKDGSGEVIEDRDTIKNLTKKNNATVKLYAKWFEESYSISYVLNGGKNNKSNPSTYTVSKSVKLKKPKRDGFTFEGWYKTAELKEKDKVSSIKKGSIGNKILYAKWVRPQYTITYKLNGGKNDKSNPTKYSFETPTFTLAEPTKKGYNFKGWYTEAKFKNEIEKIKEGSEGNLTLYAKWSPIKYTVKFEAEGATGVVPATTECKYGALYVMPWPNLVKEGYVFSGWYTDASCSGTPYAAGISVKNLEKEDGKSVTFYAGWTKMSATEETYAAQVVTLVNANRKSNGAEALAVSPVLSAVAQERAYEIANTFSHTRPDGTPCFRLFSDAGYYGYTIGENIASGQNSPKDVMTAWMNSSGHRGNILGKEYTEIGVGCYYVNGRYCWVQCFGNGK